MSFSSEVIDELMGLELAKTCCRKAMLFGLFFGAASEGAKTVSTEFKKPEIAEGAAEILKKQFSAEAELSELTRAGRHFYSVKVNSKALSNFLTGVDSVDGEASLSQLVGFRCDCCARAFVRGVFIALGTINDPKKSYHLEFVLRSSLRAEKLAELLEGEIVAPKLVTRGEKTGVYYKRNMQIADILYYLDAMKSGFSFSDVCIEHDIRNKENRATNCNTRNISRSIEVAQKQVEAITELEEKGKLRLFDDNLQYTAKMRLANPWATLSELAAAHEPPIAKSTLNRRLVKLLEKANK